MPFQGKPQEFNKSISGGEPEVSGDRSDSGASSREGIPTRRVFFPSLMMEMGGGVASLKCAAETRLCGVGRTGWRRTLICSDSFLKTPFVSGLTYSPPCCFGGCEARWLWFISYDVGTGRRKVCFFRTRASQIGGFHIPTSVTWSVLFPVKRKPRCLDGRLYYDPASTAQ